MTPNDVWHDLTNKAVEHGAALFSILGSDFMKMALAAFFGSVLSYVVVVTRLDERQVESTRRIAQIEQDISLLKQRAESNATGNTRQDTIIELQFRTIQNAEDSIKLDIQELRREIRDHDQKQKRE